LGDTALPPALLMHQFWLIFLQSKFADEWAVFAVCLCKPVLRACRAAGYIKSSGSRF